MLESRDLQLVAALVRGGSMRKAAETLGVHQSTVFRRLEQLERDLGVRLFERLRDGYQPTPAGDELHTLARRTEDDLLLVENRLRGRDLRPSGLVRVTTTDTLLGSVLPPILAGFREQHPEVELEITISNQPFDLMRRDADVAIRPTSEPPQNVVGRRIATIAFAAYAAPSLPRSDRGLSAAAWIGFDASLAHIRPAQWLARLPDGPPPVRVNSFLAVMHVARAGLGYALLPCYLGDREPGLERIAGPYPELASSLWLLTHPDLRRVARMKVFMDFVAAGLQAHTGWLDGTAATRANPRRAALARKSTSSD
jgi:DNA-binding transcriptional LysR family regulator